MDIQVFLAFLAAVLSSVSSGNSTTKNLALQYMGLLSALVKAGADVNTAMTELTTRIQTHQPILPEDWEALRKRSDAAHEDIQQSDSQPSQE